MQRKIFSWYSEHLNKEMEIVEYGHYGFSLLLLPTAAADYLEYERFQLIDALSPFINAGKLKIFSINSINSESWMHKSMWPRHKAMRHVQFNEYVYEEVIPYIKNATSADTPIYISGASFGALHSMNLFLKRPDLLDGVIAMSGLYDLHEYTKGYTDEDVYFNSPMSYLPDLDNEWYLNKIKAGRILLLSGQGDYEDPNAARSLSNVFNQKGIPHDLDIWGYDMKHDWPTWRAMMPYVIGEKF
jgi:esterase/lipase superfamily enzyme